MNTTEYKRKIVRFSPSPAGYRTAHLSCNHSLGVLDPDLDVEDEIFCSYCGMGSPAIRSELSKDSREEAPVAKPTTDIPQAFRDALSKALEGF